MAVASALRPVATCMHVHTHQLASCWVPCALHLHNGAPLQQHTVDMFTRAGGWLR